MSESDPGEPDDEGNWADSVRDSCRLGADAVWVVWLRWLRLAGGGRAASRELALMVAEKWYGHGAWTTALLSGKLGRSPGSITAGTIAYYRQWVRDNRRRLSGGD